jgi:hypothetical protein
MISRSVPRPAMIVFYIRRQEFREAQFRARAKAYAAAIDRSRNPNAHDYRPDFSATGNPCEACGFSRNHAWHI